MNFKDKLKELRAAHNLTQKEVAHKIDATVMALSGYENGYYYPSVETLLKIAQVYNVSLDELLNDDSSFENLMAKHKNKRLKKLVSSIMDMPEKKQEKILRLLDTAVKNEIDL